MRVLIVEREIPDAVKQDVQQAFEARRNRWQTLDDDSRVPTVQAIGDEPCLWLAVDPPEGRPLTDVRNELSLSEIRTIFIQVADTLERALDDGTLLVDIRPETIWVRRSNDTLEVTVNELGVERACQVAAGEHRTTPYTPPELVEDPNAGTEQSVVYSLAGLTHFTLTGDTPDSDDQDLEARNGEDDGMPPNKQDSIVPLTIGTVITTGLDSDPESRYESINDFREAFLNLSTGTEPEEFEVTPGRVANEDGDDQLSADTVAAVENRTDPAAAGLRPRFTRREVMNMVGVTGFGVAGWVYPSLGGANDPAIPDKLEYAVHSRTGTLQWTFGTGNTVDDAPAVAGEFVYVGCWDGNIYALDAIDGTEVWRFETEGSDPSAYSPVVANDTLYVCNSQPVFYAFNAETGAVRWEVEPGGVATDPAVHKDMIIGTGSTTAFALDATDGATVWSREFEFVTSSTVAAGTAYFGTKTGVYALDVSTGTQKWVFKTDNKVRSTAVAGNSIYAKVGDNQSETHRLVALNARDSTVQWTVKTNGIMMSPTAGEKMVYVSFGNSIRAFDMKTGTERWRFNKKHGYEDHLTVADETLYGSLNGNIYAINAADGNKNWDFTGGGVMGPPTVAAEHVYVGSGANRVFAIATDDL